MVTVVQGKVCAKNHLDRLSRLATIHQRYRQTDGRTDFLWHRPDLTVGQKRFTQVDLSVCPVSFPFTDHADTPLSDVARWVV